MSKKKPKKKKIYDKIYWIWTSFDSWHIKVLEKIVIHRVEEDLEYNKIFSGRSYKVYYNVKNEKKELWIRIGEENTGIALGKFRRYMVDRNGKLDIIGIKKHLHNREISEILEKL